MKPDLLSGVRVVDLTTYAAAPGAARMMADWGAEVIKVEGMTGDPMRVFGNSMGVPCTDEENPIWELENGNKNGVAINLKNPEGMKFMLKLLESADVFITNVRLGSLEKMGLDYDSLHAKFPKLVWGHISGYGVYGKEAPRPGYDVVSFWSRGGQMIDLPPIGHPPITAPYGVGDHTSSLVLLSGVLAALYKARATGEGSRINASLMNTAMWVSSLMLISTQYGDQWPKDRYMPSTPLSTTYQCSDGEWITLTVLDFDRYWAAFVNAMEMDPSFIENPRFNNVKAAKDPANEPEMVRAIEEAFAKNTSKYWYDRLVAADIAFEVARHFKDLPYDEQAIANHYVEEVTLRNGNSFMLPMSPIQINVNEALENNYAPLLGEHTAKYLEQFGYSAEEIEALKASGAVK